MVVTGQDYLDLMRISEEVHRRLKAAAASRLSRARLLRGRDIGLGSVAYGRTHIVLEWRLGAEGGVDGDGSRSGHLSIPLHEVLDGVDQTRVPKW